MSWVPAADPAHRRGVLVSNPGGPGVAGLGSTVSFARIGSSGVRQAFARYDLVGFDMRGTGRSNPISCGLTTEQLIQAQVPFPQSGGPGADNQLAKSIADGCAGGAGTVLPYLTTANAARDLDLLRQALGEKRISYFGNSYGTYLGAVYDSMFAGRTDRLVLDSNVDSEHGWYHQTRLIGRATEARFDDFADWAAENVAAVNLGATASAVRERQLALAARLDATPVPIGDLTVDGRLLRLATYALLRSNDSFAGLAGLIQFLDRVPGAPPEQAIGDLLHGLLDAVTAGGDRATSAYLAVECGDTPWPRDPGSYLSLMAADRLAYPITQGGFANIGACAYWPSDPIETPITATGRGPRNVLMLNNTHDRIADLGGALSTRRALGPRAALVVVEAGTTDPRERQCLRRCGDRRLAGARRAARRRCALPR